MLRKSLYLTGIIRFILFLQDVKIFLKLCQMSEGGERGFLNSDNVGLRGDGSLKIDVFVERLWWMAPK